MERRITNLFITDFNPSAQNLFAPHHFAQILVSDLGVVFWMLGVAAAISQFGFVNVFRVYGAPYLWYVHCWCCRLNGAKTSLSCRVNHWLILITFLQHTDPYLPHYRASEFTFPRGALSTLDRNLLGDLGSIMGWIGASTTHGISETHVLHHINSKIPHYNA